jgi:methyl-accepting chemotaxis protein
MLSNMKLGARLGSAFGVMSALLVIMASIGLLLMNRLHGNTDELASNWMPSIQLLGEVKGELDRARRASLRHVLESEASNKSRQADVRRVALDEALPVALKRYETLISSAGEQAIYKEFQSALKDYVEVDKRLLALSDQGDSVMLDSRGLAGGGSAMAYQKMSDLLDKAIALNAKGGADAWVEAQATHRQTIVIILSGVVFLLAVCVVMAVRITRSITQPLREAVELTKAVAEGDLTRQARADGRDEIGDLMRAMNDMTHNLSRLVGDVRQGTDAIAIASTEIAQGNADLSARTEQQAANLQQTAASMHQMSDTVRSNSDNARQANQLVAQATMVAAQGGEDVNEVVSTMAAIHESSRRIADIISVIDGIAFQTNILALNAAVEAARAGEQGRGFAVVASEVRSLAQRSANAAKEIKTLITDSVDKVEVGNTQVNNAGKTIQELVLQVRKVNDLIAEITSSSEEQSTGVTQINQAVAQLDQTTQQNAALVEQTSAAAESLRNQAHSLTQAVSVFRAHA